MLQMCCILSRLDPDLFISPRLLSCIVKFHLTLIKQHMETDCRLVFTSQKRFKRFLEKWSLCFYQGNVVMQMEVWEDKKSVRNDGNTSQT